MSVGYKSLLEDLAPPEQADDSMEDTHNNVFKIISHSLNFTSLIPDLSTWVDQDPGSLVSWVKLKIQLSKEFSSFSVSDVLESLMIQSVVAAVKSGDVKTLYRLGQILRMLNESGHLDARQVQAEFEFPLATPGVSVALHDAGLLHINTQMDFTWKDQERKVKKFLIEFVRSVEAGDGESICVLLVNLAFSKSTQTTRKKRAHTLILKMMEKIIDDVLKQSSEIDLTWLGGLKLPESVARDWKLFCLSFVLRHSPSPDLHQVIRSQQSLHTALIKTNLGVSSLCLGVLQDGLLTAREVTDLVDRVLNRAQINWPALLTLVSLGVRHVTDLDQHLSCTLASILNRSINVRQNSQAFLAGLLVIRQVSFENSGTIPSYSAWFAAKFCSQNQNCETLIHNSKEADFVLSELIQLVPADPEFALRAQLAQQIRFTGTTLKNKMETYRQLARTQLIDLSNQKSSLQTVHELSPSILNMAKGLICEWDKTTKIPAQIMEASMFKQPFYQNQLLPALMICSPESPHLVTARQALVEELNSRGKVPGLLYKDFSSGEIENRFRSKVEFATPAVAGNVEEDKTLAGKVNLETVEEILQILVNLPEEFQEELESSLQRLQAVVNSMLPYSKKSSIVISKEPDVKRLEVLTSLTSCLQQTGTQSFVGNKIVKIIMDSSQCKDQLLHSFLFATLDEDMLPLFAEMTRINPKVRAEDEVEVPLVDFLSSPHHSITNLTQLENLFQVYAHVNKNMPQLDLNNMKPVLNLEGARRAVSGVGCFTVERMSVQQLVAAVNMQLAVQQLDDALMQQLFSKLVQGAREKNNEGEIITACLQLVKNNPHYLEAASPLFVTLANLRRESFMRDGYDLMCGSSRSCLAVLLAITPGGEWTTMEYYRLMSLVENSREPTRLLSPLRAVQFLKNHPVKALSQSLKFSLANYVAADLMSYSESEELEMLFPAVFSWHKEDVNQIQSLKAATIMIGVMKLSELYLSGEIKLSDNKLPASGQSRVIVNKIKSLANDLTISEVEELMIEVTKNESDSFQILQSSKIMLVKTFLSPELCSPLSLVVRLVPVLRGVAECDNISVLETGVLVRQLVNRLDTFPVNQVKTELQQVPGIQQQLEDNCQVSNMLTTYFNLS